jgi:hypothetical protein
MGLSLAKRPCTIGPSLNGRTQHHGDEDVPAADFMLKGVMIDKEELGELLEDEYAHRAYFNTKGKVFEPLHPQVTFRLKHKFEKSMVHLRLGLSDDEVKLGGVKLARITFEPQTGGLCSVSMQVQCTPEAKEVALIFLNQNRDASVTIRFGKIESKKIRQPELPLGPPPSAADVEADKSDEACALN